MVAILQRTAGSACGSIRSKMEWNMWLVVVLAHLYIATSAFAGEQFPFSRYPASIFTGAPAIPKIETPQTKEHGTILRNATKRGPNFAGHYTVVDWGCGTSCGVYVIVDDRTGKIHEPPELSKGVELGVAKPQFRRNSTLIVIASCPPPEVYGLKNCQRRFYIWKGSQLVLLKTEPVVGK